MNISFLGRKPKIRHAHGVLGDGVAWAQPFMKMKPIRFGGPNVILGWMSIDIHRRLLTDMNHE